MKFVFFVEGDTERKALPDFLRRWLDAKCAPRVGIKIVRFDGWAEMRRDVVRKAHRYFDSADASDIIAVISLLDLYGPTFYAKHLATADERYDWAKSEIEREVGHPKFRHFFAVHELEAWLLSEPELFPPEVCGGFLGRHAQPETINFTEPPAKLLERLYTTKLHRKYKKTTDGAELFRRLTPETAYAKCPRLREMLDELLQLAEDAGIAVSRL